MSLSNAGRSAVGCSGQGVKRLFLKMFVIRTLIAFLALSSTVFAGVVTEVRSALARNNLGEAARIVASYRAHHGIDPAYLEALSWMGRGSLAAGQLMQAYQYASETQTLTQRLLTKVDLDSDPHLALALGAAFEVQAQVLARENRTGKAITLLRNALHAYGNTSIRARLQKNLNLLTLDGKIAPPLEIREYLGPKPRAITDLKGSVVLLFFWAHWCSDCKAEAPLIARLHAEFAKEGLVVIAPTQRYGYTGTQDSVSPAQENTYIASVRQRYYGQLSDVPSPLSSRNFNVYGASTTPTIVLVARNGRVAFYHPGAMTYSQLRSEAGKLLAQP